MPTTTGSSAAKTTAARRASRAKTGSTSTARQRAAAAGAKVPDDHKAEQVKDKVVQVEGGRQVTIDDITVVVLDEKLDDFELLDLMGRVEKTQNPALLPELFRGFFGEEHYRSIVERLRDENGKVSIQRAVGFYNRMLTALNPSS